MATSIQSSIAEKNGNLFGLIWLDSNENTKETRDIEQKLRPHVISHLKKFEDLKPCHKYIEQRSQLDRIILIVSGYYGREIVPLIHHLEHVVSIYIYCMDKKGNEQWACKFPKIKGVTVSHDELISRIHADHKIQSKIEQSLPINNGQKSNFIPVNINTKWKHHAITVAGGHGQGNGLNQLSYPYGIYMDKSNQNIYIADMDNDRIIRWKLNGTKYGEILAGGNGRGNAMNQLRIVRWPCRNGTYGETIVSNIDCWGLAMDNNGDLYFSDTEKNEVKRLKIGDQQGIIVAGGNGGGNNLNQLSHPTGLFVDDDYSIYVSDCWNHRVMKWMKDAKEGIRVAGGNGDGKTLSQMSHPLEVFVDQWENVYVVDSFNNRIVRWTKGSQKASLIIGGFGYGHQSNQFQSPKGFAFDRQGNIYLTDCENYRVQKFLIE